jgi:chorismate mutase / prephenate dehydratase
MNKTITRFSPDLKRKRKEIDQVDRRLLSLLNQRVRLVMEAIAIKKGTGEKMRIPKREREILENLKRKNRGPMRGDELEKIFRAILGMCRRHLPPLP